MVVLGGTVPDDFTNVIGLEAGLDDPKHRAWEFSRGYTGFYVKS